MKRVLTLALLSAALFALVACGAKKKAVTQDMFTTTRDGIMKNMNGNSHTLDERKAWTLSNLGEPHRTEADGSLFWYTTTEPCYYYEMHGKDGYGSFGTGAKADCDKWGVK